MDKHIHFIKKRANNRKQILDRLLKLSYIRKLDDDKYRVYSESGKNMGTYESREGAKERLKQIEYFKHKDNNSTHDITTTYSETLRELRKEKNPEKLNQFLKSFKEAFDQALDEEIEEPQDIALMSALESINAR